MTKVDYDLLLKRGVAEIIVEAELVKLLESGRPLRLKQGFDPSCPDIHLGHAVGLRKLRQFQEAGHQVVLIVGDWTAQIGDPSGQSALRPMLSAEEVKANAETYMRQFFKIVDRKRSEVRWQSEWFGNWTLSDVFRLTGEFTMAQLMTRADLRQRWEAEQPIAITELLYPLLQAYDSVEVRADVEFGGTDQKFNCIVGRWLQEMREQPAQQVFLVPLLIGTDGSAKMSKSLGNYISVDEPAGEIYGKAMSIPDHLIMDYLELVTDVPTPELAQFKEQLEAQSVNPMVLKKRLAREIVAQFQGAAAAPEAEAKFERVVQQGELPEEIPVFFLSFKRWQEEAGTEATNALERGNLARLGDSIIVQGGPVEEGKLVPESWHMPIARLLPKIGLAKSRSEARRLLAQGAVDIDGTPVTEDMCVVRNGSIIKVGKRRFKKVVNTDNKV
jgi:tyrosyl-tRNA synthetase